MRIQLDRPVLYYPKTGDIVQENPIPARAKDARASPPLHALSWAGLEPVAYAEVLSYDSRDIAEFKRTYGLGKLLTGNAKTSKPRPSGRPGIITGLALAPHFYASLLDDVKEEQGRLSFVDLRQFYEFNGRDINTASAGSGLPKDELLNTCLGSSPFCRQTCLVATGQHASGRKNAHAKMAKTYALLAEPALFVATLRKQLFSFADSAAAKDMDAVVRLNMLSDIPWYHLCPELLEELEGVVYFYDYTKLVFWDDPAYLRIAPLLDLTFSFSGSNAGLCRKALEAGHRIAVAFASANTSRRATPSKRTTFGEMELSGIIEDGVFRDIGFGEGYLAVDGDESDYRMDDPPASIVALNFKEPTTKAAPHMSEAVVESRSFFTKPVPETPRGTLYAKALASKTFGGTTKKARELFREGLTAEEIADRYDAFERNKARKRRKNPLEVIDDEMPPITRDTALTMFPISGTDFLVGPHVPTVLED
jgi:hypothetical protein